jgi:hypothetical protein
MFDGIGMPCLQTEPFWQTSSSVPQMLDLFFFIGSVVCMNLDVQSSNPPKISTEERLMVS